MTYVKRLWTVAVVLFSGTALADITLTLNIDGTGFSQLFVHDYEGVGEPIWNPDGGNQLTPLSVAPNPTGSQLVARLIGAQAAGRFLRIGVGGSPATVQMNYAALVDLRDAVDGDARTIVANLASSMGVAATQMRISDIRSGWYSSEGPTLSAVVTQAAADTNVLRSVRDYWDPGWPVDARFGTPAQGTCDTASQQAIVAAWQCANAAGGLGGRAAGQMSDVSERIRQRLACTLPDGFWVQAPDWLTSELNPYAQIWSVGNVLTQCVFNLPAALMMAVIDHLGNVHIPPNQLGIGLITQSGAECTQLDGTPGTYQLGVLGVRCVANPTATIPICQTVGDTSCPAGATYLVPGAPDVNPDGLFRDWPGDPAPFEYCDAHPGAPLGSYYLPVPVRCIAGGNVITVRRCAPGRCTVEPYPEDPSVPVVGAPQPPW